MSNYIANSFPYVGVVLLFLIIGIFQRLGNTRLADIFAIIVAFFFFALKGYVFTDFVSYAGLYKQAANTLTINYSFSPGYSFLQGIAARAGVDFATWMLINSSFHVIALFYLFKRFSVGVAMGFAFFIPFRGLIVEFNLLQNIISIILFIFSIRHIDQRRYVKAICINLFGCVFHLSSIIYILSIPLLVINYNRILLIFVLFVSIFVSLFGYDLFSLFLESIIILSASEYLHQYQEYLVLPEAYGFSFGNLLRIALFFLLIVHRNWIYKTVPEGKILFNMSIAYFLIYFLFSHNSILVDRVGLLFIPALWILLPSFFIFKHRFGQPYLFGFSMIAIALTVSSTSNYLSDYQNRLFNADDLNTRINRVVSYQREFK